MDDLIIKAISEIIISLNGLWINQVDFGKKKLF